MFIKILFNDSSNAQFQITSYGSISYYPLAKPGCGIVKNFDRGVFYNLTFTIDSNAKGTIWLNPSWNELKVDLNKIYEWKSSCRCGEVIESKLTYAIDNADKNVKFKFTYNNNKEISDPKNPFTVCHGEDCKDNIETYNFEKGQSYKIYVKIVSTQDDQYYFFPSFRFGDINGDWPSYSFNLRGNLWIVSLLLLLII